MEKDENDTVAMFLHAVVCFELGDMDACLASLGKLFAKEPEHIEGHFLRGWIHMHDQDNQAALNCFDVCLQENNLHFLALQCRAFCYVVRAGSCPCHVIWEYRLCC